MQESAVEGIWEKHAFIVIVDHRLARPERFLNEPGVTAQADKDQRRARQPCKLCHARVSAHTHSWLWPQALIISSSLLAGFLLCCRGRQQGHTVWTSLLLFHHPQHQITGTPFSGTNNSSFITTFKYFREPCLWLFLNASEGCWLR